MTTTLLQDGTIVMAEKTKSSRSESYVSVFNDHVPNEETKAAILEGDELARAYCSRFIEE